MAHGNFCLVGGLLTLKGRIDLDCLIAAVKFAHMALQAETLVGCACLVPAVNLFNLKQIDRAHLNTGAAADALLFVDFYFDLYNVLF
jgi:hypothetical protein